MPAPDSQLLITLASRLGIPTDEAAVQRRILAELDKGAGAQEQLGAILGALGVPDQGAAMQKIVDLIKNSTALLEAMPQLAELKDAKVKDEEKAVDQDVEQAIASHRLPSSVKDAMLFMRRGGVTLTQDSPAADWTRRAAARADFIAKYPLPTPNEQHLLMSLATHRPSSSSITHPAAPPPPPGAGASSATLEAVTACAGRNITEQAISFVRGRPGGDKLSFEAAHQAACVLLSELRASGARLPAPPGNRYPIPARG